jgi:hypothetical protein
MGLTRYNADFEPFFVCPYIKFACGECGTPYRRVTWSKNGKKKAVWRCISRLDYGKKYCTESPTVEESVLQDAILEALVRFARQNTAALDILGQHIGIALSGETDGEDPYLMKPVKNAVIEEAQNILLDCLTFEDSDELKIEESPDGDDFKADVDKSKNFQLSILNLLYTAVPRHCWRKNHRSMILRRQSRCYSNPRSRTTSGRNTASAKSF